jgi:protein phosphatase
MLICPECQTENIDHNKFCDQCGTSLTQKNCDSCQGEISYADILCPHCGVTTVKYYECIITTKNNNSLQIPFPSLAELTTDHPSKYVISESRAEAELELKPFIEDNTTRTYHFTVMDVKPLQKSSLDTILEVVEGFERQSLVEAGIPALAFPYLTLSEYCPITPELWDAWQDPETNQEVVIITKNEHCSPLTDYWQKENLEPTQIFAHLRKMTKLWKSFRKLNCCQSLLELDNLVVNERGKLQLHKLYPDVQTNPPELSLLLETWISLFGEAKRKELPLILELTIAVDQGEIKDLQELNARLDTLAQEAQLDQLISERDNEDELLSIPSVQLDALSAQFDFDEYEEIENQEPTTINNDNNLDEQSTIVLPMRLLSLTEAGCTDIGGRRTHNEDCFAIETKIDKKQSPQGTFNTAKGFFVVCDGMGGHAGGEVASTMAVQELHQYFAENWQDEFPNAETIKQGILRANQAIYNANIDKGNLGSNRMGTTLVMTLVEGTKVAIAHVGDSRIYRVTRKWGLEQLSTDHSVAQAEIQNGVDSQVALARPDAFQLTQALGPRDNKFVHPDINFLEVKEDTLIIMCSDGLSDNQLIENNWQEYFLPLISSQANLEEGLFKIIDLANKINGHDNITGVLIRIKVQPNIENQDPLF